MQQNNEEWQLLVAGTTDELCFRIKDDLKPGKQCFLTKYSKSYSTVGLQGAHICSVTLLQYIQFLPLWLKTGDKLWLSYWGKQYVTYVIKKKCTGKLNEHFLQQLCMLHISPEAPERMQVFGVDARCWDHLQESNPTVRHTDKLSVAAVRL